MQNTHKLTKGAVAVALASVLSFIVVFRAPYGGSVTAGSMAPIIIFSFMYGTPWGLIASSAYAGIQMILGFYPPPVATLPNYFLVVLLDYIIAFGGLGLANALGRPFGRFRYAVGAAGVSILRFAAHFLSGMIIWHGYAPEDQPVWLYSLLYNGGYMICELVISVIFTVLIVKSVGIERLAGHARISHKK
jgi:thiamine transporter